MLGFAACAGMLAFGYYLQYVKGLEPCPLCIIQRVILLGTGIWMVINKGEQYDPERNPVIRLFRRYAPKGTVVGVARSNYLGRARHHRDGAAHGFKHGDGFGERHRAVQPYFDK